MPHTHSFHEKQEKWVTRIVVRDYSSREQSTSLEPKKKRKKRSKPTLLVDPDLTRGQSPSISANDELLKPSVPEGPSGTNFSTPKGLNFAEEDSVNKMNAEQATNFYPKQIKK